MANLNIECFEGQTVIFQLTIDGPDAEYEIYGGTAQGMFRVNGGTVTAEPETLSGHMPHYDIFARSVLTQREWRILSGVVRATKRYSELVGEAISPKEYLVTIPINAESDEVTGENISVGLPGAQGPAGPSGPPGMSAYQLAVSLGFEGSEAEWLDSLVGPQGYPGEDGEPGIPGKDGAPGKDGKDGADGENGVSCTHSWNGTILTVTSASGTSSANLKGEKGEQGLPGEPGKDGADGKQGEQGIPGEKGEPGADGKDGAQGEPGKDGVSCKHSWNGTTLTITSASGTSSANLKGDKGDQGPAGEPGEKGEQGDPGERGAAFTYDDFTEEQLALLKGPKGDPGEPGQQGVQGVPGAPGSPGAPGEKGETGEQGPPGKDGADGVSCTHTWNGTILSITSASGTSSSDLKGEKGEPGPQGEPGANGKDGATGPQGEPGKDGEQGPQGIPGKDGENGKNGADGVSCTHSWNGTTLTVTSASGTSSANLKGEQGEQGIQGIQGPPGEQGEPGEKGETGADGAPGKDGSDGISCTHSWNGTVLTVTSASGTSSADLKGEQGPKGDPGLTQQQIALLTLYASAEGRNVPINADGTFSTQVGHTYAVSTTSDYIIVSNANGDPIADLAPAGQVGFVANTTVTKVSSLECSVTEVFKAAAPLTLREGGIATSNLMKYAACTNAADMAAVDPDYKNDLTSSGVWLHHLPALVDGTQVFQAAPIKKFVVELPNLTNGTQLFHNTPLEGEIVLSLPKSKVNNAIFGQSSASPKKRKLTKVTLRVCGGNPHTILNNYNTTDSYLEEAYLYGFDTGNADGICVNNNNLRRFYMEGANFIVTWNAGFSGCKLDKESVFNIRDVSASVNNKSMTIGIAKSLQNDSEVLAALDDLRAKGWVPSIQWNGYAASSVATYGLRRVATPPIYARLVLVTAPDGTEHPDIDWGHQILLPEGQNLEDWGFREFASVEEAREYWGLEQYVDPAWEDEFLTTDEQ